MQKSELVEYVKRQLGYPTVNVELTDEQISDSIDKAINEIKPWYTVFKYITLDVVSGQRVDLTEYQVQDVTDVIKVFDVSSNSTPDKDPFSYSGMTGYYATPMYAISRYSTAIMTNKNIHKIISSYASLYQEQFYSRLAMIMRERTNSTLSENISWKYYDNYLYVDTGSPNTSVITIEYVPEVLKVEDFEDNNLYTNYLKDLSVAFSLIVQARVVGKYEPSNSPVRINSSSMRSDAERDIDRIRADIISKVSNRFYITT